MPQKEKRIVRHLDIRLKPQELINSGSVKMLVRENKKLEKEIASLKESLKASQDAFENLRSKNHDLDKQNSLLNFQLDNSILAEVLKFLISAIGAGFAVSLISTDRLLAGLTVGLVMVLAYTGTLYFFKKKI